MEKPEKSWFRRTPPHNEEIEDVWGDLFQITCEELCCMLPDNSPVLRYLGKQTSKNLHACITTLEAEQEEQEEYAEADDEIPTFTAEAVDQDGQMHIADDGGGIAMHERLIDLDEQSELRLEMAIRSTRRRAVTAGITYQAHRAIQIPHNHALYFVSKLSRKYRRIFADIMLYQLADHIAAEDIDEGFEDPNNLASIIDNHFNLPNIRAFHAALKSGMQK